MGRTSPSGAEWVAIDPEDSIITATIGDVATGTVNVRFESGASGTALTGVINLVANTGFSAGASPWGHFETAGGQLLNLELSGATSVDGWLTYVLVPA